MSPSPEGFRDLLVVPLPWREKVRVRGILPHQRLYRESVHGSTGSPRTDHDTIAIKTLAVRPELVEGFIPSAMGESDMRNSGL